MYKQVDTDDSAILHNGENLHPVATLEDEFGGRAHIWTDDGCYELGLERTEAKTSESEPSTYTRPCTHIFPEAFSVLRTLPELPIK